ncbi:hypothetical protein AXG93_2145s1560 [Marchantia polymorpha subsp. ruderalis]|uniref:Uncharacterized protein n=1 Tax=Marchantia polymorpha subsp. ruderalis TaxID=1480154 RepID=A0A176VYL7_MARPO|nr:hypothetical protein AXG93_2145s1560 [Marchantia polymorpha subsp. ruderalis]
MTRSQATLEDTLDSSKDDTSNIDPDESFSDDESLEDTQADPELEKNLDLEKTMNMLRQVTLVITRDDTMKKHEKSKNLTTVLCFLDRGLSTPQVHEWAEAELIRSKKLKIVLITAIGSRNYHIRFQSQRDRDLALSRTRITYLRQDFIIVKWTLEAEDLSYSLAPVILLQIALEILCSRPRKVQGPAVDPNGNGQGRKALLRRRRSKHTATTIRGSGEWKTRLPRLLPPLQSFANSPAPKARAMSTGGRSPLSTHTSLIDNHAEQAANGDKAFQRG